MEAVPFDLELEPFELGLVVSGPNTGGKTVLLKAVGLITALVQTGVVPPVGERSELPIYTAIVADIGDRQSIADNLSTFSAHLAAVRGALEVAGPGSLALLDEIGSGTDPVEGAALAAAVLETLVARQSRVVATTHLGDLKKVAAETAGVVNASLTFDAANLTPTYELVKGVPGRSYGLVMAKRLGLDSEVIGKAEARRPAAERSLDMLLAEVEQRAAALSEQEAEATARLGVVQAREARLAAREKTVEETEHAVRERQGALEREGREQARRFLLEARKRVEEALGMARAAVSEATAKEARRLVEEGISQEADELRRLQDELARKGWRVKGKEGDTTQPVYVEHRGGMRVAKLRDEPAAPAARVSSPPAAAPISEVDLRGMDAEDARDAVMRAVDAAVLADLPVVRLIHGKGTGVLRRVVDEALRADARVSTHRLAPPREGGTGVTIAELA